MNSFESENSAQGPTPSVMPPLKHVYRKSFLKTCFEIFGLVLLRLGGILGPINNMSTLALSNLIR